ncbi:MAG: nickel-binding protein [Saprospiraceae bacterium]
MDLHILPGVKARDVAEAHRLDLMIQGDHRCNCMTYWIDEKRGTVFCLIDAPNKAAVSEMHRNAHGLIPHKIIEVNDSLVEAFLGRIHDPENATLVVDGLHVFSEESLRIVMVILMSDPILLEHKMGKEKASAHLRNQYYIIQKELASHDGSEVKLGGTDCVASFVSAGHAIRCAMTISDLLKDLSQGSATLHIGLHAGEPVSRMEKIFGETIQLATILGSLTKDFQVAISSVVKELAGREHIRYDEHQIARLTASEESFLEKLFSFLEERWQDTEFTMDDLSHLMALSTSQLYRKTLSLTGYSPHNLLKEFRLHRAKELMKRAGSTIAEVTFQSGFSSPSYFTKCFKKKYGLLPNTYMDLAGM